MCSRRCFEGTAAAEIEDVLAAKSDLKEVARPGQLCSVAAGTAALWVMIPALLDPGKQLWPSPDTCQVADQVRKHPALAASKGSYQVHQNLTTEDQGLRYLEAT